MTKSHPGWFAALLMTILATCLDLRSVRAADGPENEVLKKHGLKITGSLAVATEEADVKSKLSEAKRLSKQLSYSLVQQKGTMSPKEQQQHIKTANDQISQLRSELNAVNQQISTLPRGGGGRYGSRFGGGNSFSNNSAAEMYADLTVYKNQLQMELNQDSLFLNQIKGQAADPKAKDKIDSEVRERHEAYHQALLDLRKLVDAAHAKYGEAATNDDVKQALGLVGKGLKEKPKLGPSHEFLANVKLVEKLEKAESSAETDEPQAGSARRSRHRAKGKSASKAASTPAPTAAGKSDDES